MGDKRRERRPGKMIYCIVDTSLLLLTSEIKKMRDRAKMSHKSMIPINTGKTER